MQMKKKKKKESVSCSQDKTNKKRQSIENIPEEARHQTYQKNSLSSIIHIFKELNETMSK